MPPEIGSTKAVPPPVREETCWRRKTVLHSLKVCTRGFMHHGMRVDQAEREMQAIIAAALDRGITPEVPFAVLVGLVVSVLRLQVGKTQAELGECAGITQATLSRIESGESALDAAQAYRVAQCIGIAPEHIFVLASKIAERLKESSVHVSGDTPSRANKSATAASKVGAAALAPIVGASLLGPVGLVIGAMVSGRALLDHDKKRKQ